LVLLICCLRSAEIFFEKVFKENKPLSDVPPKKKVFVFREENIFRQRSAEKKSFAHKRFELFFILQFVANISV